MPGVRTLELLLQKKELLLQAQPILREMFFHKSYFWEFFINNAFSLCVLNILVITGIHTHTHTHRILRSLKLLCPKF